VRLAIVSHVVHYRHAGQWFAYGPYAREIDMWADLFPEVVIASPLRHERPPDDATAFTRFNIDVIGQRETGGDSWTAKAVQVASLPWLIGGLIRVLRHADAVHVRCPGNLGLLGAVLAPCFTRNLIAKYAGQWNGYSTEPATIRLQRAILRSRWWAGPVTVYGTWLDQPAHVVSFFTSMMTRSQVRHAVEVARHKTMEPPVRVLFSGMLQPRKRVDVLIEAVAQLRDDRVPFELVILGDGPQRASLERQVGELSLHDDVRFVGARPFNDALRWYEWAHVVVLPSRHSEGWPKVMAEAMAHGALAVAVDHGQVGSMLAGRGVVLPTGSADEIAGTLRAWATEPGRFEELRLEGVRWAGQHSLEDLRDAIGDLLSRWWHVPVRPTPTGPALPARLAGNDAP
jgi:glycosyltransferase involved in cell wall biosynthesis